MVDIKSYLKEFVRQLENIAKGLLAREKCGLQEPTMA